MAEFNIRIKTAIKDIKIGEIPGHDWREMYLKKLWDYSSEPYFQDIYYRVERTIEYPYTSLAELNTDLIMMIVSALKIPTTIVRASSYKIPEGKDGSAKVLNICKFFGEDEYLAGEGGRDYMRLDEFEKAGIKVHFNDSSGFEKLSAIDHLFRYGS